MNLVVPDGARLADLHERRRWLSRVEIVYALPKSGILVVIDDSTSVALALHGVTVRGASGTAEIKLDEPAKEQLASCWSDLWLSEDADAPDADGRVVLLHHVGLFGARHSASSVARIDALVARILA